MRKISAVVVAAMLGVMVSAQATAAQEPVTPTDSAQHALRATLRMLASAQEIHYSRHFSYATDAGTLTAALRDGWRIPEQVQVRIVFASDRGHGTVATHPLLQGQSCVMWIGDVTVAPELLTARERYNGVGRPGRVTCDFDGPFEQGGPR
jgi:hypothetical protein